MDTVDGLQIVLYQPNSSQRLEISAPAPRQVQLARWEKLADRISSTAPSHRWQVEDVIGSPQCFAGDDALGVAIALGERISSEKDKLASGGVILLSLCSVLYFSGRTAPETLDQIIKNVAQSSKPKYLDTLKRGARIANEIIGAWAERSGGNILQQLDRATQVVLQARLSVSQWGTLSEHGRQVKERILARPLPQLQPYEGSPLLIPSLIHQITNGSLNNREICRYLGYSTELAARLDAVSSRRKSDEE